MMVFKRKQIVVLSLVLMIVIAGYFQYSYNRSSAETAEKGNDRIGEAVYVDNREIALEDQEEKDGIDIVLDSKDVTQANASKEANDYFAQARMDKEVIRGRDTDSLKEISEDVNASKEIRTEAYDKMMKIVEASEKELRIETLIEGKGFSDAVALLGDDGSVDIIVKSPALTSAQTAQIADIASRQAKVSIDKITVTSKF